MTEQDGKVREDRLRRVAARRGLRLEKSRRRDKNAVDYGGYMLIDADRNYVILGATQYSYDATLDDVEEALAAGVKGKFSAPINLSDPHAAYRPEPAGRLETPAQRLVSLKAREAEIQQELIVPMALTQYAEVRDELIAIRFEIGRLEEKVKSSK